jgi:ketosteroid isomerase-like protein
MPPPAGPAGPASPAAPQEVVEQLLDGISNGRWEVLHGLYAEDAVIEYPFALPAPRRLEGRPAIRRYFEAVAQLPLQLRVRDVVVQPTTAPGVLVVEYGYDGLVTEIGRSFRVANIQVTTVQDGLITNSRDYHDHLRLAAATDQLTPLLPRLTVDQT